VKGLTSNPSIVPIVDKSDCLSQSSIKKDYLCGQDVVLCGKIACIKSKITLALDLHGPVCTEWAENRGYSVRYIIR
jgi:hypothetical protein